MSNPNLKFSNHSAGIFSVAKAQGSGKRSSMHGSRPKIGPRTFSRSGKRGTAHHRGLVSLRISDGKFVNHTTEMILWSMILTLHHQSCPYDKPGIRQQIAEQKLGTIRQNGVSCLLCLRQLLIAAHFLITLASSKIVLVRNSAPSIGRWASFSSPRAHHLGVLFPFLHISCPKDVLGDQISWQMVFHQRYEKYWILPPTFCGIGIIFEDGHIHFAERTWIKDKCPELSWN